MQLFDIARIYDLCNLLGVSAAVSHSLHGTDLEVTLNPKDRSELDIMLIKPGNQVVWYDRDWKSEYFEPERLAG